VRIAACVCVKDEVELIAPLITHLRAIGVDAIVVCDMFSTDGTVDVLEGYAADDDIDLFQISDREEMEPWAQANLARIRATGADWAIFLDADEVPIPASGSLKDCAGLEDVDVLALDRFNVPLTPSGLAWPTSVTPEHYEDLLLLVQPIPQFWQEIEHDPSLSWMRSRIADRVMARPPMIATLTLGMHDVVPAGDAPARRSVSRDLVVAHLPFTTRARFARKVDNIRALLAAHDGLFVESHGRHWRRWASMAEAGTLDLEFDRMVFDSDQIAELRHQQVIRSAAELFGERTVVGED